MINRQILVALAGRQLVEDPGERLGARGIETDRSLPAVPEHRADFARKDGPEEWKSFSLLGPLSSWT
jgi:hypothetical protein